MINMIEQYHPEDGFSLEEWDHVAPVVDVKNLPHVTRMHSGLAFGKRCEHYPNPTDKSVFTNPYGPGLGQVAQGDAFEVVIQAVNTFLGDSAGSCVFHYTATKITGNPTLADIAGQLGSAIKAAFNKSNGSFAKGVSGLYNPKVMFGPGIMRSLKDTSEAESMGIDLVGQDQVATGTVPQRSAVVARLGTAKRGRSFQGRKFLWAIDESRQRAGKLEDDVADVIKAFIDAITVVTLTPTTNQVTMGIYSRKLSKDQPAPIVTPVTSALVHGIMGSQRRRQAVDS